MTVLTRDQLRSLTTTRTQASIVALVDARKIEIFEYAAGQLQRVEEIRAHHVVGQTTHLGASRAGFHAGTRGGTARDRVQRGLREGTARMERQATRSVVRRASSGAMVFVAGTPQHRRDLFKRLSDALLVGLLELESLDIHATPAEIAAAVEEGSDQLRCKRVEREVMALIEAAGARGPAALGAQTTSWALGQGRVQSLYLTRRFVEDHIDVADALVQSALSQHADVDVVSDGCAGQLDEHGGVAARLRYRLV